MFKNVIRVIEDGILFPFALLVMEKEIRFFQSVAMT